MSTTTIRWTHRVNGTLTNVTSAVLRDPTAAFGLRRLDTLAVVVAAGQALALVSTGVYEHTFTDPAPGLLYQWYVERVFGGETYRTEYNGQGGGTTEGLPLYLTLSEADAFASELLSTQLVAYNAANSTDRTKALKQATLDVDTAMRYQGRRYDLSEDQVLEFPRVPYEYVSPMPTDYWGGPVMAGAEIWDWDGDEEEAVIPRDVKLATLFQADSLLDGKRRKRLAAQHDGVSSQGVGSLNEAYSGKPVQKLCLEAYELVKKYQLRSGQLI